MTVELFGKQGCSRCTSAKKHLETMGFNYNYHNVEYHTVPHSGWRDDLSVEIMAEMQIDGSLPKLLIGQTMFRYSEGMKVLKQMAKCTKEISDRKKLQALS